eukprot:4176443-Amphidinium_carterae.1
MQCCSSFASWKAATRSMSLSELLAAHAGCCLLLLHSCLLLCLLPGVPDHPRSGVQAPIVHMSLRASESQRFQIQKLDPFRGALNQILEPGADRTVTSRSVLSMRTWHITSRTDAGSEDPPFSTFLQVRVLQKRVVPQH